MVEHICEKCNATFTRKSNYIYHINKKTPCVTAYKRINDKYQCNYCPELVSRVDIIKKHIDICIERIKSIKNKEIDELKNQLEDQKNINNQNKIEIHRLKLELKKSQDLVHKLSSKKIKKKTISSNIDNSTNNTINNNTTNINNTINNISNLNNNSNNTTNLISIVNFGDESISKLTTKDKKEILENCLYSILKCVEKVHFNDAIPEQQNSYITGLKSEYGYKYIDGKFIATDIDDLIDTIIENRKEDVREILENRKDMRISKLTIDKIEDLLDKLDSNEGDLEYIRKEIRLLLFNNREKVINNKLLQDIEIII
jgi:hypothetical protein